MMMKKMLFFVNPAAGKEEMRFQLMDVIDYFTANGYDVLCHPTQKPLDIPEFLQARGEEFDMVVTCGGDGTLNETVSGLMTLDRRPVLGYIPAGTVNDFATSLHIPKTIKEAAQNIVEGEVFPVDMGGFNDRYLCGGIRRVYQGQLCHAPCQQAGPGPGGVHSRGHSFAVGYSPHPRGGRDGGHGD